MTADQVATILTKLNLDAYLIYDFRNSNHVGRNVLDFHTLTTRRFMALFTKAGEIHLVVPKLEESMFGQLSGEKHVFETYQELHEIIKQLLANKQKVAIDYSSNNDIPVIDVVPAGFVELARTLAPGIEFVSSANLAQYLAALWSAEGYDSHKEAARIIKETVDKALDELRSRRKEGRATSDYDLMQFIMTEFEKEEIEVDHNLCIVSTNEMASNPHYAPSSDSNFPIKDNSVLLFDVWGRKRGERNIYADSTLMAWVGPDPVPAKVKKVWEVVRDARNIGIEMVKKHQGRELRGYQVDREVRDFIIHKGYGRYFVHRTGHSIDTHDHGNGANLDDFETHDERLLLPQTGFSIEPGIYLPEFGVRSEIDMFIDKDGKAEVTTFIQEELFIV